MGSRRLDRRSLTPRDYLVDPFEFGRRRDVVWHDPPAGDDVSLRVAQLQHDVALILWVDRDPYRARRVGTRFQFSKQYWSACLRGESWMGETLLAAALWDLMQSRRGGTPCSPGLSVASGGASINLDGRARSSRD